MAYTTEIAVAQATIAAEVRFVEEGHHAILDRTEHCFTVVSDRQPGVRYQVRVGVQGTELRCTCTCPAGTFARHGKPVPCKHAAGVLHRGERERWARFDGTRWVLAGRIAEIVRQPEPTVDEVDEVLARLG